MIKIIRDEKEIKKYIKDISCTFQLYKSSIKFGILDKFENKAFKELIEHIKLNDDYKKETLKGKILYENILGDKTLTEIAGENMYSVAHIYNLKNKILKEFAAITFEVILL